MNYHDRTQVWKQTGMRMKRLLPIVALLIVGFCSAVEALGMETVMVNASFDSCAGKSLTAELLGCATIEGKDGNRFAGVEAVCELTGRPLRMIKSDGSTKGLPMIFWQLPSVGTGVLQFDWDAVIEQFTPGAQFPGREHLLSLNVIGAQGRVIQAVRMLVSGAEGEGQFDIFGTKQVCGAWKTAESLHLTFAIDLDKKRCTFSVNGKCLQQEIPFEGGPVLGFNFRDGGGWGCYDGTFTAGIDNLKVTQIQGNADSVEVNRPVKVACCGDSITLGIGVENPAENSYPAKLQRLLGDHWLVKNFGVGGRTLLRRVDAFDIAPALEFEPDIVIIALGTNDSREQTWQTHGAEFSDDYDAIINAFRQLPSKPKIYVCLPPPMFPGQWGLSEELLSGKTIPEIRKVAARNKLPIIDLHAALIDQKPNFPDTIHPNAMGAAKIAELVEQTLKKDRGAAGVDN